MNLKRTLAAALLIFVLPGVLVGAPECDNCIAVYGDSRSGHEQHKAVVNAMLMIGPKVVFHTGDYVSDPASQDEWDIFSSIAAPVRSRAEFFPVVGNHEVGTECDCCLTPP